MRSLKELSQKEMQEAINQATREIHKEVRPKIHIDPKKGQGADFFTGITDRSLLFKLGQRDSTVFLAFNSEPRENETVIKKMVDCFSILLGGQPMYVFMDQDIFPFSYDKVLFWGDPPQSELKIEGKMREQGFDGFLHPSSTNWQFAGKTKKHSFFVNHNPKTEKTEILSIHGNESKLVNIFEKILGNPASKHFQMNITPPVFIARWSGIY
ncbi:MAG: hypothetical protein R6V40_00930 [Candidatus Moraniibacteriota bacterium]